MSIIATAADFEVATETDRFALDTGAPDLPRVGSELDIRGKPIGGVVALSIYEDLGAGAVAQTLARLQPMLFALAWRVVDLVIELALNSAVAKPPPEWNIAAKQREAKKYAGQITPITNDPELWRRVCLLYAGTVEARHCLVHRTARRGPSGELAGLLDRKGTPVKDVTVDEQVAMVALARRLAGVVISGAMSSRSRDDIFSLLDRLAAHHGMPVLGKPALGAVVTVRENAVASPSGGWEFDTAAVLKRARSTFQTTTHFDVAIYFPGFSSDPLVGQLESAPQGLQRIDPNAPPAWLT